MDSFLFSSSDSMFASESASDPSTLFRAASKRVILNEPTISTSDPSAQMINSPIDSAMTSERASFSNGAAGTEMLIPPLTSPT